MGDEGGDGDEDGDGDGDEDATAALAISTNKRNQYTHVCSRAFTRDLLPASGVAHRSGGGLSEALL